MPYIDKLKAVAMLLVVMGHTLFFSTYHEQKAVDPVLSVICTFHVPLFFFLSGFVISQAPTIKKFLKKAYRFLTPMLVVGLINAMLIDKVSDFFLNDGHNGYWYLLTLTIFYLLLVPYRLTHEKRDIRTFIIDSAMTLFVWAILYVATHPSDSILLSALNPWACFAYWPFFILGYLCRKYGLTDTFSDKRWATVVLPATYLTLLFVCFPNIDRLPILIDFTIAAMAIAALLSVFRTYFNNSETLVDRQLLYIGNNTLSVYIYHYFFIRFISLDFLTTESLLIKLMVTITLTIAITYASIAIAHIVHYITQTAHNVCRRTGEH